MKKLLFYHNNYRNSCFTIVIFINISSSYTNMRSLKYLDDTIFNFTKKSFL